MHSAVKASAVKALIVSKWTSHRNNVVGRRAEGAKRRRWRVVGAERAKRRRWRVVGAERAKHSRLLVGAERAKHRRRHLVGVERAKLRRRVVAIGRGTGGLSRRGSGDLGQECAAPIGRSRRQVDRLFDARPLP